MYTKISQDLANKRAEAAWKRTSYRNFVASSRLEGIHLDSSAPTATLEEIIQRYMVKKKE